MKIHHLNCGTMCPIGRRLIHGEGSLFATGKLVCHCWLIETDHDGLILVDTGYGTHDVQRPVERMGAILKPLLLPKLDMAETALRQVEALGFAASDVRHVIPTHLDMDHAGGLTDFPKAEVHTYKPEYDAAMARRTFPEKQRYRPIQWAHGPNWQIHDLSGERWQGFDAVRTLEKNDRVLFIPLVGHTRGHCGVAVQTDAGWQLHAGDAYFHHEELDPTPKVPWLLHTFQASFAFDDSARRQNQARLRELKASHPEIRVNCAHSVVEWDRSVG